MKTLRYCVALSATTLVLAGCGADAEPKFEAEPSSTPTSASPTPDKPEPWEERSDEGAIAFVEHWIDAYNRMRSSGETDAVEAISSKRCESCIGSIELTRQIYSAGGSLRTTGWKVVSISEPAVAEAAQPVIGIRIERAPQVLRESADAEPQRFAGGPADYTAHLMWESGRWLMDRLDLA
jgi:hypothetical protein